MSGFAPGWLALREPYDLRARNTTVLNAVVASLSEKSALNIVDLACGAGSTLRALAPRLSAQQAWRLADNDRVLLAHAADSPRPASVTVTTVETDLNRDLETVLGGGLDLIATSALLDLVSEAWLVRLVREAAAQVLPVYCALSYDGQAEITPADDLDAAIVAAVNAHQQGDKGFGPALGPLAAQTAIARFEAAGYAVVHGPAAWSAGPQDQAFQMEIFRGWAGAARELGPLSAGDIDRWLIRRGDAVAAGRSSLTVGHVDFFARPGGAR